jgi:multidrug resistance efflux pump
VVLVAIDGADYKARVAEAEAAVLGAGTAIVNSKAEKPAAPASGWQSRPDDRPAGRARPGPPVVAAILTGSTPAAP